MSPRPLLYYITDRSSFPGNASERRRRVLEKIADATRAGVDYIQLREKDLSAREFERLAKEALGIIQQLRTEDRDLRTALLINSRTDVALAVGADGVHLRSDDLSAHEVREIWQRGAGALARENARPRPVIAVSCHSPEEVGQAARNAATFAVFAPVFEKKDARDLPPAGLAKLREACQYEIPVLALGGITLSNAASCLDAGAAGIAAIRLFQENDIASVVREIRSK